MLLVLLVCAAPVVASYWVYFFVPPIDSAAYATLIQPSLAIPAVDAVDVQGRRTPLQSLKHQWLLVVAADAACDQACEARLFEQRQLHAMMGRERDRIDKVWLAFGDAALRPELQRALSESTPPPLVLRIPQEAVAAWLKPDAGQALSAHLYLIDPMGEWMMRTPMPLAPEKFKRDLERLLRASASWDRAGR